LHHISRSARMPTERREHNDQYIKEALWNT
jgi:hypothetical protein